MANVIKHKRGSGSDPVANDLVVGEVAIRTDVGKLFTKMDNGSVAEIAGGGSDIAINTLSSSSGTGGGSATFNGSAYRFTLSAPPSVSAQQLLVSINGVIQKPVAGTGQPSEGFSVDGTDIILGDAPATGSDFFILTFKSLGVSEPADNSVTSAKIVDGAIVNADINASAAIAGSKISPDFGSQDITTTGHVDLPDASKIKLGTGDDLNIFHDGANSYLQNITGNLILKNNATDYIRFINSDASTQVVGNLDVGAGIDVTGAITATGDINLIDNGTIFGGDDAANTLILRSASGNNNHSRIDIGVSEGSDNGGLHFYTAGSSVATRAMTIKGTSQNIGIGTISPQAKLDIRDSADDDFQGLRIINTKNNTNAPDSSFIRLGITNAGGEKVCSIKALQEGNLANAVGLTFSTNSSGSNNGETEKMRIDSSGRVMINNTFGSSAHAAADDLIIGATSGSNGMTILTANNATANIFFNDGSANNGSIQYIHSTSPQAMRFNSAGQYEIDIGGNEKVRIDSSGRVGINETSPQQQLHVHDDTIYNGILINGSNAPRIGFARQTTTSGEWSVGIDGTNGNNFAINNSNDNSNRKLIITSSQIQMLQEVSLTANLKIANPGSGIDFSATSDASGMSSELLNDYEEGTFTPTNSTVGLQSSDTYGYYQKVGNWVTVQFGVRFNSNSSSVATHIDGLPFNMTADTNGRNTNSFAIGYHNGNHIQFALGNSSDRIFVYSKNGNTVQLTHMDNDYIQIFGTYKTS